MRPRRRQDLVRPFVLTGGRARPTRNTHVLDVVTMVTATGDRPLYGLQPEQLAMIEACRDGYLAVIEVAGHTGLPLTLTRVLLADLLDTGHLVTRVAEPPAATNRAAEPTDVDILERLLHGLKAL
ncbi:DUF742 domain-containing protein [Streptomyces calidiresistens]|uniref:DUF742 domain-containing protein n=2 Tax=Streptomyces TaxID=1883 RepID=A0A7W3TBU9_9ACTN|nr:MULTISPECIES: DUF742 domain-containing protein [Streptomyces]MBB0229944.1 DUF742 domain-containing protein [Streptomyces calidiresistens]MBB0243600.1 DUF742 domain-containing protein [Streptomyces alkaliphilus]MCE7080125.1 DUF742 domain-containing protein [Streptomyces sp. ST2-7A]